jgi:hypothetical protein
MQRQRQPVHRQQFVPGDSRGMQYRQSGVQRKRGLQSGRNVLKQSNGLPRQRRLSEQHRPVFDDAPGVQWKLPAGQSDLLGHRADLLVVLGLPATRGNVQRQQPCVPAGFRLHAGALLDR